MPSVVYTAERELVTSTSPIHAVDTTYVLNFAARVYHPRADVDRTVHRSIGGQQITTGHRHDRVWVVQPVAITEANLEFWHEFLHSVQYGESFVFDYDDNSPLAGITVILDNADSWEFSRVEMTDYYQLTPLQFRQL